MTSSVKSPPEPRPHLGEYDHCAPVDITFDGLQPTAAAEERILGWIRRLESCFDEIRRWRITASLRPSGRQLYLVIELAGVEIRVSSTADVLALATESAFNAASEQLERHHLETAFRG